MAIFNSFSNNRHRRCRQSFSISRHCRSKSTPIKRFGRQEPARTGLSPMNGVERPVQPVKASAQEKASRVQRVSSTKGTLAAYHAKKRRGNSSNGPGEQSTTWQCIPCAEVWAHTPARRAGQRVAVTITTLVIQLPHEKLQILQHGHLPINERIIAAGPTLKWRRARKRSFRGQAYL